MLFSEDGQQWQEVPSWVKFLIRFGFQWPCGVLGDRRIALISMPCDSAAAALIALGALIRDLGNPNANDIDGHYGAMLRYAHQYLEWCRDCAMRCRPELKGCGYAAEATGWVRGKREKLHRIVQISELTTWYEQAIVCLDSRKSSTSCILRQSATSWHIDGAPPPQLGLNSEMALPKNAYEQIVEATKILSGNLCKTFSGLCLAGRIAGETASREQYSKIRFKSDQGEYSLLDLLAIHEWSPSNIVSRMAFFNSRTGRLDRRACDPALVVADGAECFLKVLGETDFQRSDAIGIIHRTMERDPLEGVGNRMINLRGWYVEDSGFLGLLPVTPCGITALVLRKRTS